MIDSIANELLIASRILHTNNVSAIAQEIGYRPMLIITALYKAQETGKFTYNKKSDTITQGDDIDLANLQVTEGIAELTDLIEQFVGYMNKDEKDMSTDELMMLLGGVPDLHIKIVAFTSKKLASYEYSDPKDKDSTYTFLTLKENVDKRWGTKQFDAKKSKARKFADQVVKEGKKKLSK
jgi:tRNA/tmRNA/rRNA uracil-C5-methylase (TrmA/RlmC/RlmD family)